MTAPAAPPTDLKTALVELRASVAARRTGKGRAGFAARAGLAARMGIPTRAGLAAAIEEAILNILSMLLAMLEDFRAGRFVPMAAVVEAAAAGRAVVPPPPRPSPARAGEGVRGSFEADSAGEDDAAAPAMRGLAGEGAGRAKRGEGAAAHTCRNAMRAAGTLRRRPRFGMISDCDIVPRRRRTPRGVRRAHSTPACSRGTAAAAEGPIFQKGRSDHERRRAVIVPA